MENISKEMLNKMLDEMPEDLEQILSKLRYLGGATHLEEFDKELYGFQLIIQDIEKQLTKHHELEMNLRKELLYS